MNKQKLRYEFFTRGMTDGLAHPTALTVWRSATDRGSENAVPAVSLCTHTQQQNNIVKHLAHRNRSMQSN